MRIPTFFSMLVGICLFTLSAYTQDKPNVVMIVLDDLNDYLGVMEGHPQAITPHLDKLAEEGVLFANAHSNAPVCAPSRSSFMTGILPSTSLNYGFAKWYENETLSNSKTLAQYFRENGYDAYRTGKIMHQDKDSEWTATGIKKYQGPLASNGKSPAYHPSVPAPFAAIGPLDGTFAPLSDVPSVPATDDAPGYTGWWHFGKNEPFKYVDDDNRDLMTDEESALWFENKLADWENENREKPFFVAFGIMNPHTPHVVPKKYFDKYPLDSLKIPVMLEGDNDDCHYDEVLAGKGRTHFTALKESYSDLDEGLRAYLQGYLACVSFADDIVGQVVNALDNSKFKENTIVILFSDHGYNMGEKDYLFKNSLWEESTRVPFIVRDPRYAVHAGKQINHPISLVDVYPSLADLCDLTGETTKNSKGASLDGHSIKPFLEDPENREWDGPDGALTVIKNPASDDPVLQNYSIRSTNYRYVRYSNGAEELYDHTKDSYEWVNEIKNAAYSDILAQMRKYLKEQVPGMSQINLSTGSLIRPTDINIFPNPASQKITLDTSKYRGKTQLNVFDSNGKRIVSQVVDMENNNRMSLPVNEFRDGLYIVQLSDEEGNANNYKIVVEN